MPSVEERVDEIQQLLNELIEQRIDTLVSPFQLHEIGNGLAGFERERMERYSGIMSLDHSTFREFLRRLRLSTTFNAPYTATVNSDDWEGEEPDLYIRIPYSLHRLLGAIDVNIYQVEEDDSGLRFVRVSGGYRLDSMRTLTVTSSVRFPCRIDVFCSVGNTSETLHQQPVYTVNGMEPDVTGNVNV
jgi:hypothetical protein